MIGGPLLVMRETADVIMTCQTLTGTGTLTAPGSMVCGPLLCAGTANGALMHCLDSTQGYDLRPAYFMLETEDVVVTCQTLTD